LLYRTFEKQHDIKAFTFKRQYPDILFPGETQYVTEKDNADKIDALRVLDTINPLTYIKSGKTIANYNPDILLMKFWMPFFAPSLGLASSIVRKKRKTKSIAILDNVIPHEKKPMDIAFIKYFLARTDRYVVMSSTVEKDLLQLKPDAKYILKPHPLYEQFGNAIDKTEAKKKLNLPLDKKIILFFGFIRDYKGLDELIRSMGLLPADYHLVIAGESYGSFDKYNELIKQLKLSERISLFVRYIDDFEVPSFFSAADVCVLPYKSATQSGIVQIAYNFNMPVIATDKGGLSEMITDNKTGLIIPSHEPTLIAGKIEEYFKNNCYSEFSKNIQLHREDFSWEGFAEAIIKLAEE
jgi:glycosyltransferase involved in cell wall biosynthesis